MANSPLQGYVFVASGTAPSKEGEERTFAEVLSSQLNGHGIPTIIAYMAPTTGADEFWDAVNQKVLTASLVLGCLEEAGDPNHMCTLGLCSIFTVSVAFSRRHTTVA